MLLDCCFSHILPCLDISGYFAVLTVNRYVFAIKTLSDMPTTYQWVNLDAALPRPTGAMLRRGISLQIHARKTGLDSILAGSNMRFYQSVVYYAGSVACARDHLQSLWCLLQFTTFPVVSFWELADPHSLVQVVSDVLDVFENAQAGPQSIRLAGMKANAPM